MSIEPTSLNKQLYQYLLDVSLREPEVCKSLRQEISKDPLYFMQCNPDTAQFLALILRLISAKRCLEIGVYLGYTTLRLALELPPDGEIIACDISDEWSEQAAKYWQEAKVADKIKFRKAPALETLGNLIADTNNHLSYDFAFIDADKNNYSAYYELCLKLIRPNGIIAFDNTLWHGDVARPEVKDESTEGIRALNNLLAKDERIDLSLLSIGDGLSLVRKK